MSELLTGTRPDADARLFAAIENAPPRFKVVLHHGEAFSVFSVVDTYALDQPCVLACFPTRVQAFAYMHGLKA